MNEPTSKLPSCPRPAPEVAAVLAESRANRLLLTMLAATALAWAVSASAKAAERDPRIVECEAKWGKLIESGQKEGNEKKVAFATKKKLACAEDMAELIQVEKEAEATKKEAEATKKEAEATGKELAEVTKRADEATIIIKHLDVIQKNRPIVSAYIRTKNSLSKEEIRGALSEYEHAVNELLKRSDLKPETYETLRLDKKVIELAKKKIGQ